MSGHISTKKVKQTSHPDHIEYVLSTGTTMQFPSIFLCLSYPFLPVTSGQGLLTSGQFSHRVADPRGKSLENKKQRGKERERESDNLKGYPVVIHHRFLL